MRFSLNPFVEDVFVLGAGASVDYGLPVWKDLSELIRERISNEHTLRHDYREEILSWLQKVGSGARYSTLDECIEKESVAHPYHANGDEIENEIFLLIKDIFQDLYKPNTDGWTRKLNDYILQSAKAPERKLGFVNYNYDQVLEDAFLNFDYLPSKYRRFNFRDRVNELSSQTVDALYPHGNLFTDTKRQNHSHLEKYIQTIKSGDKKHLDVVSCFESQKHVIEHAMRKKIRLFILGLGSGMRVNLDNISVQSGVSSAHVTVRDDMKAETVVEYLSEKYQISKGDISVYSSCQELIEAYTIPF